MKTYTGSLIPKARALRSNMPEPERRIWFQCLKQLPVRFRRQRPFGPYIVDFYCAALRLVVEIDGDSHGSDEAAAYDRERSSYLEGLGLCVVRFSNQDVMTNIEGVFDRLREELGAGSIQSED
jgi:very-short-patch-repair endonuclease